MDLRFVLLLACFFLSGFAALLYQTAWTRELSFVFGTSDLAVAAVLGAYMGGLALGAAAAARLANRVRRPVLVYGVLELAIALCALAVPLAIRGLNALYIALLGGGDDLGASGSSAALAFQLASAFAVLLPPTALMGATLPLLARHAVHRDDEIAPRIGFLYAINTTGAIAGTLCAAFWLMPELGLRGAVWVGAAMNALVFVLAALLARQAPLAEPDAQPEGAPRPAAAEGASWILPAVALSGVVSFSYEVLWTRLLGQLLGASIHAFATMLASFLLGIALGSAIAAPLAGSRQRARSAFALAQLGIAITAYFAFSLADRLPDLAEAVGAGPDAALPSVLVAMASLLPVTLCIGATFPFAVRVLARDPDDAASATARIYAWNTVGAIIGSIAAGFFLLPKLGFTGTLTFGVMASLALALLAALSAAPRRTVIAGVAAACVLAVLVAPVEPPWKLLSNSPLTGRTHQGDITRHAVGRTTTVMVYDQKGRYRLTTDGLPESRIDGHGIVPEINVAQWMGALPALLRPGTRDLLVIGLGGAVTLELLPERYDQVDVIELEPEVLESNQAIASLRANDPLSDPRIEVHLGDARGTLQLASREFGGIVSQPSHPWTAGASHLYTREFFSLVRSRLAPDGVFVQWIGIRFLDEALLRSVLAALLEAFPHVELFLPRPYGLLFVASEQPIDVPGAAREVLANSPEDAARLGLLLPEQMMAAWALDERGVRALAEGAPPNTDDHNLLAARSSRLGDGRFEPDTLRSVLAAHDPLERLESADRAAVVRALVRGNQVERAKDVAAATPGDADEEIALGWVELLNGQTGRASRHFARARELAPEAESGLDGLAMSRRLPLTTQDLDVDSLPIAADPARRAVIEGWRHNYRKEWGELAALEEELAAIGPDRGLYNEATRLRAIWRVEIGDPDDARDALELTERLLLRSWSARNAFLRARAGALAGEPRETWGALRGLADRRGQHRELVRRGLPLAKELPEGEPYDSLRVDLDTKRPRPRASGS